MHTWTKNLLAIQKVKDEKTGLFQHVPVYWFPKCSHCNCLVTMISGKLLYRATPSSEWSWEEPACHVQVP